MRRFLLLLPVVLLVAACDSDADGLAFQTIELNKRGDATLAIEGGELVVSGLDGNRSGGFTIPGTSDRVDVEVAPLTIPAGGRFGIEVEDASGNDIASFYNTATAAGEVDFIFDFPSSTDIFGAFVLYKQGGENGQVVFEGLIDFPQGRGAVARIPTGAGKGTGSTGSTHVIRVNGRYVVVSDSGTSEARVGSQQGRSGCLGFFATPPSSINPTGQGYCTDWIEVEPVSESGSMMEMPVGTVSVTARGVGSFRVRQLRER